VRRKEILIGDRLRITEETLKNFEIIEEKNTNKKPSNLQAVLGELEAGKKNSSRVSYPSSYSTGIDSKR
jgi:hypothetical protein